MGLRRRSPGWIVLVLVGVSLGFACTDPRRRDFCGRYADTVSECCPEHDYDNLRSICELDLTIASGIGKPCVTATRTLYYCAEDNACMEGCEERTPEPCATERQAMVGACSTPLDPPQLP